MKIPLLVVLVLLLIIRLRHQKTILLFMGLVVLSLAGLVAGLKALLAYKPTCRPPACYALKSKEGSRKIGEYDIGENYAPEVEPLELGLELANSTVAAGARYTLLYRFTLRNRSDSQLHININAPHLSESNVNFYVWGPDGQEIPQVLLHYPPRSCFRRDAPPWDKPSKSESIESQSRHYDYLDPGESVISEPAKTGDQSFVTPPAGFNVLSLYKFKNQGRYRIQIVYNKQIYTNPLHPFYDALPKNINPLINPLLEFLNVVPDTFIKEYRIHAESKILNFIVAGELPQKLQKEEYDQADPYQRQMLIMQQESDGPKSRPRPDIRGNCVA
jgi:hypothetical protein